MPIIGVFYERARQHVVWLACKLAHELLASSQHMVAPIGSGGALYKNCYYTVTADDVYSI